MKQSSGDSATTPFDMMKHKRIMIVAGEASGDIYGADLVQEVSLLDPATHFLGIGGVKMRAAGVEILTDAADMAVMGLVEVFKSFGIISSAFLRLKSIILNNPPDLLILIDYPGFNLRLAKVAKKAGVKILFYISPKVWAWKAGRIKTIAARVDHIAVIFPFEVPLYQKAGLPVTFVGHPLIDLVKIGMEREEALASFSLDPGKTTIGLFPGSRKSEIDRLLPDMLTAATLLRERFPETQFVLPLASTLKKEDILRHVKPGEIAPLICDQRIHDLIKACDTIIAVSGTVTLEIALIGTPMVIIYRMDALAYQVAKRVVKIKHIGLCNIVAGRTLVKELIQEQANPEAIADEIGRIISDKSYHNTMKAELSDIREKLGGGGAAGNVAKLVDQLINTAEKS